MDVMRAANAREASGAPVVHMEVGQPGTSAPRAVIEAAKRALDQDRLGYTEALGLPELRERIAGHYREVYGVSVSPERIMVTTGSSAGFVLAFLAVLDPGGRIALPSPGYPCYRHILSALGGEAATIETDDATRWMPVPEHIEALAQQGELQGLLLASPANPTGTMLVGDALADLVAACQTRDLWFISDEIYHGLDYTEPAQTALAFSDAAIVINSFSKYFSMTGWRIGWMVVPDGLVRTVERLAQNLYISPPTLSQRAAIAAFDARDDLEAIKAVYAANRELLLEALPKAGLTEILPADGAFYLYADVTRFTNDSAAFAQRMLNETGVAATPGVDFDADRGSRYIRFSYAGRTEDMAEATRRLTGWLK
ncbi:MAG: aminotransferase class I/II-fold pyridoxal phosphate-dependent enzyme [Hyphomicrobiales bacterium]|nr:aminotransferase class I/II-fold pyridoxal phosphate-dependent enzyme [Hyphomicrobiales bacterium]